MELTEIYTGVGFNIKLLDLAFKVLHSIPAKNTYKSLIITPLKHQTFEYKQEFVECDWNIVVTKAQVKQKLAKCKYSLSYGVHP